MEWENNHPKIPNINILRQYSCLMPHAVSYDSILSHSLPYLQSGCPNAGIQIPCDSEATAPKI